MDAIKNFRKCNKMSQVALAEYLNVTQGFISQIEKDICPIPDWVISKILDNPHGWNTSMLSESEDSMKEEPRAENSLVEYLQRKIRELEGKIDQLNEEKMDLLQENAVLKYENMLLAPDKRESAGNAADSLSADAI